jgi:hypothetical protein
MDRRAVIDFPRTLLGYPVRCACGVTASICTAMDPAVVRESAIRWQNEHGCAGVELTIGKPEPIGRPSPIPRDPLTDLGKP